MIVIAGVASRQTVDTNNIGAGGSTTVAPGTFFQQVTPQQADASQPWANSLEFYITPWGFLKGAAANNATVSRRKVEGKNYTVLTWSPTVKAPSRQKLRNQCLCLPNRISSIAVETWSAKTSWATCTSSRRDTGWKGFRRRSMAPSKIVQTRGGWPFFEVNVDSSESEPPDVVDAGSSAGTGRRSRWRRRWGAACGRTCHDRHVRKTR